MSPIDMVSTVLTAVKVSSLLDTVAEGIKLLSNIPGALDAFNQIKAAMLNVRGKKTDYLKEDSTIAKLARQEEEALKRLIDEFSAINDRPDLDEYVKEQARKRLAAQICRTLNMLKSLLEHLFEDYDKLKDIFCQFAAYR